MTSNIENRAYAAVDDMKDTISSGARSGADALQRGKANLEKEASQMGDAVTRSASDLANGVADKLKNVGVDTDVMVNAAKDQASELQRMIGEELRARPMRALGVAAVLGVFVGLMTAR
jgi:ElaB/YqjD/DUF883 family membrane-anchored ribosome-binding protein